MADTKTRRHPIAWVISLAKQAIGMMLGKAKNVAYSLEQASAAEHIVLSAKALGRVKEQSRLILSRPVTELPRLNVNEQSLVRRIRNETARQNRNNVTRTAAYLQIYRELPELHWAFLAHMVSRNAGWTMTDLKGDLLPCLLGPGQREALFRFLERANGFIFHDAYPQLLLYREGVLTGQRLLHLLPHLGVTAFMGAVWDDFLADRDSALLTCALIINEQHFIESRVVQVPYFKSHVIDTFTFKTQSLLQLNQIIFPYHSPEGGSQLRLAGLILENFADLRERIRFGQQLYAILFGIPVVYSGSHRFTNQHNHTGSRADFWPELFAPVRRGTPNPVYRPHLDGVQLAVDAAPLFSPRLEHAWKDRPVEAPEPGDWFRGEVGHDALQLLPDSLKPPFSFDMSQEYPFALYKIELAILAAQELGTKD